MSKYNDVCEAAIKKKNKIDSLKMKQQERYSYIKRGICPSCGDNMHVENHDWSGKFWKSFITCNNGYYIHSCSKCGISKRFEYAI